jgi:hypothetical protein
VDNGWSSWFPCEQVTGEKCQCRTRSCTQPCQGNNIDINLCEGKGKILFGNSLLI